MQKISKNVFQDISRIFKSIWSWTFWIPTHGAISRSIVWSKASVFHASWRSLTQWAWGQQPKRNTQIDQEKLKEFNSIARQKADCNGKRLGKRQNGDAWCMSWRSHLSAICQRSVSDLSAICPAPAAPGQSLRRFGCPWRTCRRSWCGPPHGAPQVRPVQPRHGSDWTAVPKAVHSHKVHQVHQGHRALGPRNRKCRKCRKWTNFMKMLCYLLICVIRSLQEKNRKRKVERKPIENHIDSVKPLKSRRISGWAISGSPRFWLIGWDLKDRSRETERGSWLSR